MHNTTVQQPLTGMSPNSNTTIVMLQAEAGFVSKHNVVPVVHINRSSHHWGRKRLLCEHSTILQTASVGTSGHRMMRNRLNPLCYAS
ncbi:hypothetical protein TNCV_2924731 [Trichonephila clavipes]|nr:hypothetical protein TNCV_2924731 [Trichonephila clavipes]